MWWSIYSECPRETTVVNFQKRGIQDIWCGALRCKSEALPKTCNSFILIALWFIFQSVSISEGLLFVITSDSICCQKPGRDIMFERGSKQFLPVRIWPYHTKDQSSFHHITSFTQLFKTFVLLWCINIPLRETENSEKRWCVSWLCADGRRLIMAPVWLAFFLAASCVEDANERLVTQDQSRTEFNVMISLWFQVCTVSCLYSMSHWMQKRKSLPFNQSINPSTNFYL